MIACLSLSFLKARALLASPASAATAFHGLPRPSTHLPLTFHCLPRLGSDGRVGVWDGTAIRPALSGQLIPMATVARVSNDAALVGVRALAPLEYPRTTPLLCPPLTAPT